MNAKGQFSATKKAAMKVAGTLLSHPQAYRAAAEAGAAALKVLPHFAIYNRLNAWGRRRDLPGPVVESFHQWYARNRTGANPTQASRESQPGTEGD
jgi:L-lactate dehydrogenase complex protein LldF